MGEYSKELRNRLIELYPNRHVYDCEDNDIAIDLAFYEDLDEVYKHFFSILGEMPEIAFPRERVAFYISDGTKTYKHVINPDPNDFNPFFNSSIQ